jgi:hypothetical protein
MVFFKRLKEKELLWKFIVALAGSLNIHLLVLANLAIMHGFEGSKQFLLYVSMVDFLKYLLSSGLVDCDSLPQPTILLGISQAAWAACAFSSFARL